jgi:hypothetical protein
LDRWVEQHKVGVSSQAGGPTIHSTSASGAKVGATTSPRAKEILDLLRSEQRPSTLRLYPVDGGRDPR